MAKHTQAYQTNICTYDTHGSSFELFLTLGFYPRFNVHVLKPVCYLHTCTLNKFVLTLGSLMDKIEEANLHKKKRLAARSEMISLAKTLETERDGHKAVSHALQYGLVPKAIEQASIVA